MSAAILPALVHGAWLCAWMTVVIFGSLRHDPRIWTRSAPPALRELLGAPPPATHRRRRLWATLMLIGLVGVPAHLMHDLAALPGGTDFAVRALAAYLTFEVFNLYDALVIDIGVIVVWAPAWAFVPGTRGHPSLRDWRFHLRAYLVGVILGVPFALLVAALAALWPH